MGESAALQFGSVDEGVVVFIVGAEKGEGSGVPFGGADRIVPRGIDGGERLLDLRGSRKGAGSGAAIVSKQTVSKARCMAGGAQAFTELLQMMEARWS